MSKKENNKLIAEFMGYTVIQKSLAGNPIYDIPTDKGIGYVPEFMKYDSSWDWLMPVVEEIESITFDENNSFNVTIGSTIYCIIQDANGECYDMTYDGEDSKLAVVYKAVVEFIKWLNQNKDE